MKKAFLEVAATFFVGGLAMSPFFIAVDYMW